MDWNLKTTGIIIAIFFLGYIIGLVEAAIKQKSKENKKIQAEAKERVEPPAEGLKTTNLLSINRNVTNDLVIELEGKIIAHKEELSPEEKRILVDLLIELRPWVDTPAVPIPQQFEKKPETTNIKTKTAPEITPPSSPRSAAKKPELSNQSIVAQIDAVLQNRLASSPLRNQSIRLIESPAGGVRVYVGLEKYDGIDAIPDPEIKDFIRQAVADWEGKS